MIPKAEIVARVREWSLREDVVEKDYVLGWLLWGIGADPELGSAWAFKGGTCLKKCYIETYRFSEDLDFTLLPGASATEASASDALARVCDRVGQASGIDFSARTPKLRLRPGGTSIEGRVYYRGPRAAPGEASVKIDLSITEIISRPTVLRSISHPFPDTLPAPAQVRCYSFDEVFAEKIRAMGERGRPRDLYDIVNLYRRGDLRAHGPLIKAVLGDKCHTKGVSVPTLQAIRTAATRTGLENEWASMLAHQLPVLPPFGLFWDELPDLFAWLDGAEVGSALPALPAGRDEDQGWTPPPTMWTWGAGVPLESIRFAAANHLCVELGYHGSVRTIEPYSLRRSREGRLLLHAIRTDSRQHRSYHVAEITSVKVTTKPFRPVWAVEFAAAGPMFAAPSRAVYRTTSRVYSGGTVYIVQCPYCDRTFRRSTRSTELRAHKDADGCPCPGRHGEIVDEIDG